MSDSAKILKLLNLTSSQNDAEALAALRMAQKFLEKNLGDYLSFGEHGLSKASSEKNELYLELESLFEAEVEKVSQLKKQLDDKDKSLRKRERDVQNLKREIKQYDERIEDFEKEMEKLQAKARAPGPYEELEKLYEIEVEKNDRFKKQLDDRDKTFRKQTRNISSQKRESKTYDDKLAAMEKTIDDLAEELMSLKNISKR